MWTKFLAEMNSGIFEACINVKVKELECTGANDLITQLQEPSYQKESSHVDCFDCHISCRNCGLPSVSSNDSVCHVHTVG